MGRHTSIAVRMALVTAVLFGLVYPLAMTGIAQAFFPRQANGSLVLRNARVIGSELIGQSFASRGYFHSRPSAAGAGYDASSSGGSNLGPTSRRLMSEVRSRVKTATRDNPGLKMGHIPRDMVTSSGSGLDPDISLANAYTQLPRVSQARGLSEGKVRAIVSRNAIRRQLGFLGEPRVNVLRANMALDAAGRTKR